VDSFSLETARWLCGSAAQLFAALVVLAGLFAVYKLQVMRGDRTRATEMAIEALSAIRSLINARAAQEGKPGVNHPRWAQGRRARDELRRVFETDYVPWLQRLAASAGGAEQDAAQEALERISGLFRQVAVSEAGIERVSWWTTASTVANGFMTLGSLFLLFLLGRTGFAYSSWVCVLLAASVVALVLTTTVCIKLIWLRPEQIHFN